MLNRSPNYNSELGAKLQLWITLGFCALAAFLSYTKYGFVGLRAFFYVINIIVFGGSIAAFLSSFFLNIKEVYKILFFPVLAIIFCCIQYYLDPVKLKFVFIYGSIFGTVIFLAGAAQYFFNSRKK